MLEILKYMTSGFWIFIGTISIVGLVIHYCAEVIMSFFKMAAVMARGWSDKNK